MHGWVVRGVWWARRLVGAAADGGRAKRSALQAPAAAAAPRCAAGPPRRAHAALTRAPAHAVCRQRLPARRAEHAQVPDEGLHEGRSSEGGTQRRRR